MPIKQRLICAILALWAVTATAASPVVLKEEKRVYDSSGCIPRPSCNTAPALPRAVKELGFWVRDYRLPLEAGETIPFVGSVLYAWYETKDPIDVEEFAFVQYVRGCVYSTSVDPDGKVNVHYNVTRTHLEKRIAYAHLDWEIDTATTDPLYGSEPKKRLLRHYTMEWNTTPKKFPNTQGTFYGDDPPMVPRLHMKHSPLPPAHIEESSDMLAINHSLEYRTCLYRTNDIPKQVSDARHVLPNALSCFDWASSHVFNHKEKKFESPAGIVGACRPEQMPDATKPWE